VIITSITTRTPTTIGRSSSNSRRGHAGSYEQALVSLKLKKSVDAEGGRTFAVIIEGG